MVEFVHDHLDLSSFFVLAVSYVGHGTLVIHKKRDDALSLCQRERED